MSLPGEIIQGILARSALVILRVYLGVVFVAAALPKIQRNATPEFIAFLEQVALQHGHPFYQEFVRAVVLPNAKAFAGLIGWGELVVGVMLIPGLLTRFWAAFALLLALNYLFAKGDWFWTPSSTDAAFIMISLALLIGAAGRTLGLDAFLARRWPRSPFW
jgi:thiosulfate dehydrogenase [quinone] large subunit